MIPDESLQDKKYNIDGYPAERLQYMGLVIDSQAHKLVTSNKENRIQEPEYRRQETRITSKE
jgi:ribosomal protein S17